MCSKDACEVELAESKSSGQSSCPRGRRGKPNRSVTLGANGGEDDGDSQVKEPDSGFGVGPAPGASWGPSTGFCLLSREVENSRWVRARTEPGALRTAPGARRRSLGPRRRSWGPRKSVVGDGQRRPARVPAGATPGTGGGTGAARRPRYRNDVGKRILRCRGRQKRRRRRKRYGQKKRKEPSAPVLRPRKGSKLTARLSATGRPLRLASSTPDIASSRKNHRK